jgi:5-methylcytosine-specific restriction endonuclease McrA
MASAYQFIETTPTTENYFRGIVLFGRNVASYKFALAKSLIELAGEGRDRVSLEDLAVPFSLHLCDHLKEARRQSTSAQSRFLDACRQFNEGSFGEDQLRDTTVRLGFNNVIDAFHVVGQGEVGIRFFEDDRKASVPGIAFTDELNQLAAEAGPDALGETEARWRLVETAWDLSLSSSLIAYDSTRELLVPSVRRVALTSARDALNGYQKGRCFYCYRPISIVAGSVDLADVDHFIPHTLQAHRVTHGLDQVWNLVLACSTCNRGPKGKFDAIPGMEYLDRLFKRNEYLITSHHPLRETLMNQTGVTTEQRHAFFQSTYDFVGSVHPGTHWVTAALGDPTF